MLEINYLQFDTARPITYSFARFAEKSEEVDAAEETDATVKTEPVVKLKQVSLETSIKYMTSDGK